MKHDYSLRGRCKEESEALVREHPNLTLVRGYYHCHSWGKQPHWWTKDPNGVIHDPTAAQFPSLGCGEYEEFSGIFNCSECNSEVKEEDSLFYGRYAFCSEKCIGKFVGVFT